MSRIFTVPPEYLDEIEAVVAAGVDACRRDEFFRREGQKSALLVPDFMLKEGATAEVMVLVASVDDMPKLMEAMQRITTITVPAEPAATAPLDPGQVWIQGRP